MTQRAFEALAAKMEREWTAYRNARAAGELTDAAELLAMYNANGFRLAKLKQRLEN